MALLLPSSAGIAVKFHIIGKRQSDFAVWGKTRKDKPSKPAFEKAGLSWFVVVGGDFKLPEANEYDGLYEGGLML